MAVSSVAPSPPADGAAAAPLAERLFPNNEWVLLVVIAVECLVFGMAGHNFATAGNAFEITRLGVEIGLLALALTPIIVTGGIDLSVGSMMGLAATSGCRCRWPSFSRCCSASPAAHSTRRSSRGSSSRRSSSRSARCPCFAGSRKG
jgi:hypothetical protein